ncbi:unnamed protein product [Clonostachys chloroleuca]|uniref:Signal recognition particle receptor subunit beta n=1 Tax=Clonostachys chloroleuca TaxID=1926264 RepID=A0AA35Q0P0_9HYPO|nr:unnamed protein product [Clonostachys chloroleuca]
MPSPTFWSLVESSLTPSYTLAIVAIVLVLGGPIILHLILSNLTSYIIHPQVVLIGPDGVGKTSLMTLFERGDSPSQTHTSQKSHSVELNASTDSSSKYSYKNHEDTTGTHTKFLLIDTPGHGKLRNVAMERLVRCERLKAIVFMVDAAALGEPESLAPTASYLYDILLFLQKRVSDKSNNNKKNNTPVPVLIAANKVDLFTALPSTLVKTNLEAELSRIRSSRSKGLLDSGVGIDDVGSEEQDAWLGEYGSEKFSFKQMQEFEIDVDVLPGNVTGDGPGAEKWWWWIAQRI